MVESFFKAWSIWMDGREAGKQPINAMRAEKQSAQKRHAKLVALAQTNSVTTEPASRFAEGATTGATAGVLGVLGVTLAITMCSRKSIGDQFQRV